MRPEQVVLLVLGILAAQVAIWIPVLLWLRARSRSVVAALAAELDAAGERARIAPEPFVYGGASGTYPGTRGNAVVALTDRRIVVRRLAGPGFEIARSDITSAREAESFRGRRRGASWVVVATRSGAEVGLLVRDQKAWVAALAPK